MALTFEQAFGPNAKLYRSSYTGYIAAPFYIDTRGRYTSKSVAVPGQDGEQVVTTFEHTGPDAGIWRYNAKTKSFDFRLDDGNLNSKPTKSVSAADLGLGENPAFEIAGLATQAKRNGDTWSNYALTHNDYGGGVGSTESVMRGAADLQRSIGDITGYENKKGFGEKALDFLAEKGWTIPLTLATAGAFGPGGAFAGTAEGAGAAAEAATGAATGGAEAAAGAATGGAEAGGGYFGGIGGNAAVTPGLESFGAAAGSSAIPEIGIGSAVGSSAAPSLFSAAELASAFPGAYSALSDAAGPLSTALKTAKTASQAKSIGDMLESGDYWDAAKTIGGELLENAPSIGTLLSILSDDGSGQTIGGQGGSGGAGGSAAWMNQALPTINIPAYRSNVIQGDPYRYGMGAEQALYTDQSGNLPRAQNFGTSGGRPFGVQYNFEQAPAQSGGLASIQPSMQQPAKQALTQQDVTSYLSSKGLDLTPEGVQRGLAIYNSENPNSQLTQSDIGAAFGYTPEQSRAWMQGQNAPTQTQSGGLASIQPTAQPARQALTQQDVTSYLSSKGLDLTPEGVQRGLAIYNNENLSKQYSINDVGAAFGFSPEQSRAWMYEGQTKAPSGLEALNWYKNQYVPTQTQSGGSASIKPSIQPTAQPAPAPAPVQAAAKPALTQQDVTAYLAANNLNLDPSGISTALAHYNGGIGDPSKQYSINDVGAAFGYTPEQSRAWMQGQNAPTQTQSGGLASIQPAIQPSIQPTTQPAPVAAPAPVQAAAKPAPVAAPAPVQAAAKPALTQKDVTDYLSANNLQFDPSGVSTALAHYNGGIGDPSKQYSINDVGAAFGYTPEQSRAWMQGQKFAEGGAVGGCNCGGLSQAFDREEEDENERYVDGDGGGQDDDVEARVSSGEYVFDADVVSALGDGNNEAGARILDELRAKIRQHKRAAPANKIPPKAKSIEQYLKEVR